MQTEPADNAFGTEWERGRRRRRLMALSVLGIACLVLLVLILRNNASRPNTGKPAKTSSRAKRLSEEGPKMIEVWDGKEFRISETTEFETTADDYAFSYRLEACSARTAGSPSLDLSVTLDLHFDEGALLREIEERESDLRVIVNYIFSSKGMEDLTVSNLRDEVAGRLNELVKKGKIKDVRFVKIAAAKRMKGKAEPSLGMGSCQPPLYCSLPGGRERSLSHSVA